MLPRAAAAAGGHAAAPRCITALGHLLPRSVSTATSAPTTPSGAGASTPPTAIVLMNMGGPGSLHGPVDGVGPFLQRLFRDGEIIKLGRLQHVLGPYIAKRRTPRIVQQYTEIGGKSPIGDWTAMQGAALLRSLTTRHPASLGPFKVYTAFRYAPPLTEDTLLRMKADGVTRAIAFSQYPQFSCTTTGSSLNHLWREAIRLRLDGAFQWSLIDRWHSHPGFLSAVARRVALGLAAFPPEQRSRVIIVFSAHSVPMLTVNKGDPYVKEVAATVAGVMGLLRSGAGGVDIGDGTSAGDAATVSNVVATGGNPHILAWQSKVGFLPWMGPSTSTVIHGLGKQVRGRGGEPCRVIMILMMKKLACLYI